MLKFGAVSCCHRQLLCPYPRLEYPNMETHPWDRKQMMLAEGTSGTVFLPCEFCTSLRVNFGPDLPEQFLKKFEVLSD